VPVYEFRCESCGERFSELVAMGTGTVACPACGTEGAERVLSAQAPSQRLALSPGNTRKQERKNAALHARAKADFKAKRQAARARREGGSGS
jgi:putative FmdB family regulatory protein